MADQTKALKEIIEVSPGGGGHEKAFPPLDPATWAPQFIWLAISFIVLYVVMSRVALPRIGTVIEERRDRIASDLDEAAKLNQQTEEARVAYEEALAQARSNALATLSETREKVNAEIEAETASAEAAIAKKISAAEASIEKEKSEALGRLGDVAAEVAETIVTELIGGKLTKTEVKQAVTKALAS